MSYTDRRAPNRGYISVHNVAEGFVEVGAVVVREFPFHHHIAMYPVAEASAYSDVVGAGTLLIMPLPDKAAPVKKPVTSITRL
jgi:hypothetical protein